MGGEQERGHLFEDINPASAQLTHRIVIADRINASRDITEQNFDDNLIFIFRDIFCSVHFSPANSSKRNRNSRNRKQKNVRSSRQTTCRIHDMDEEIEKRSTKKYHCTERKTM